MERIARQALLETDAAHGIRVYDSAQGMLDALTGAAIWPALFLLDIMMKPTSGLDAARELRRRGADSTIVFVTTTPDFAIPGYEVGAYRYLLKPVDEAVLTFAVGAQVRRIDCRDILYIEGEGRGVRVHTRTESLPIPEKISEISARLPIGHLVKCHQSFIVNIEYVRLLRRYEA